LPFASLRLECARPRALPRGYPLAPVTLGDHLRRHRLDQGRGQRTVAALLGVRPETLRNWELGHGRPSVRHWPRLIAYLDYDPEPADGSPGARLCTYRRRLGLTQTELAAQLELDDATVADLERGARRASRRVREMIERFVAGDGTP
jgi:transcriptional regulator with XRE-family HTH domain